MAQDPPAEEVVEMPAARDDRPSLPWPGILVGVGLAGTLDEVVLHQVRADAPDNLPYDLAFLTIAATTTRAGALLLRRARQPTR